MHKVLVLYNAPADPEAFISYYESTHLPLAQKLPGMLAWRYTVNTSPGPDGTPAPYFAVFEADFPDAETYRAAMASPEGQAVGADVPNYATAGATVFDFAISGGSEA